MGEQHRQEQRAPEPGCSPAPGETRAEEVERLFREHNEALVRFLALRLRSREEAREVAQEAYVRLLELGRTDVTSFLRAYLFRIASNLAIDRLRRRTTESRYQAAEMVPGLEAVVPEADHPERQAQTSQSVELLRGLLEELPAPVRDAFLLFRVEGLDQETIARRLGITDRMVRNHITRALVYCRLRLDGLSPRETMANLQDKPAR